MRALCECFATRPAWKEPGLGILVKKINNVWKNPWRQEVRGSEEDIGKLFRDMCLIYIQLWLQYRLVCFKCLPKHKREVMIGLYQNIFPRFTQECKPFVYIGAHFEVLSTQPWFLFSVLFLTQTREFSVLFGTFQS